MSKTTPLKVVVVQLSHVNKNEETFFSFSPTQKR